MARFYANENLPDPVVVELRRLGHDVLTMRDSGHAGRAVPDSEVLGFAAANGRAVVTLNRRHFVRLHQDSPAHAGIVVCPFDPEFAKLARRIHDASQRLPSLAGQLVRINRPS